MLDAIYWNYAFGPITCRVMNKLMRRSFRLPDPGPNMIYVKVKTFHGAVRKDEILEVPLCRVTPEDWAKKMNDPKWRMPKDRPKSWFV